MVGTLAKYSTLGIYLVTWGVNWPKIWADLVKSADW